MDHSFAREYHTTPNAVYVKADCARWTSIYLLALMVILALLPALSLAGASLDEQLIGAVRKGNVALVRSILDKNADFNPRNELGVMPFP